MRERQTEVKPLERHRASPMKVVIKAKNKLRCVTVHKALNTSSICGTGKGRQGVKEEPFT